MLVLSRKLNETIVIGNNIRIRVVGISGSQVRLGIEAPGAIKVMREELLARRDEILKPSSPTPLRKNARRAHAVAALS
jgi:carbon storage regulator